MAVVTSHSVARACGGPPYNVGFLHRDLPDDRKFDVAVTVEITAVRARPIPGEAEGRILSVVHGQYSGSKVLILNVGLTSCDSPPFLGQKGIVVGKIVSVSDDALVIDPIRTLSEREIYLKTGKPPTE